MAFDSYLNQRNLNKQTQEPGMLAQLLPLLISAGVSIPLGGQAFGKSMQAYSGIWDKNRDRQDALNEAQKDRQQQERMTEIAARNARVLSTQEHGQRKELQQDEQTFQSKERIADREFENSLRKYDAEMQMKILERRAVLDKEMQGRGFTHEEQQQQREINNRKALQEAEQSFQAGEGKKEREAAQTRTETQATATGARLDASTERMLRQEATSTVLGNPLNKMSDPAVIADKIQDTYEGLLLKRMQGTQVGPAQGTTLKADVTAPTNKVKVKDKQGNLFFVPREELAEALKQGYVQVP